MKRKLLAVMLFVFMLLGNCTMATAADNPIQYDQKITVTQDGGRYQVGFVNIEFKKDSLDPKMLPAAFEVQVYLNNGVGCIEFSPDVPDFYKNVHIRIDNYSGYLYDRATGKNVYITVKQQQILTSHFCIYNWGR